MSHHSSCMVFKTNMFNHKIILIGIIFSNSCLFSSHTLAWACVLHLELQLLLVSFIYISVTSQQISIRLVILFTLCMLYKYRLILSLKVITECTLHNRVNYSITHISIIIYSSNLKEDCYINVNCDSKILCKIVILVMNFSKIDFNGLDLFILLIHIPISRRAVVSHEAKKKQHACALSGLRDHYSELFIQMAGVNL